MAIGDTVQAGLMRVDFSPFLEAGRANAAANASFGQALGQVAKGYIEGQEKKARSEEMTGYLMNQGVSEKDAKAISKNPFLQKEYQRKKASEAQMKMEEKRLANQANIAAQGRAARQAELDEGYRRQDEGKAETNAFYDRLNDLAPTDELTPEAQQRIDSFSSTTTPTDPRRLAQVNDPQAFMERVENDPSSYVQKPVYELQGRDFLSQFEDPGMFQKALAFQQANQPKALDPFKLSDEVRKATEFGQGQDAITFTPERNTIVLGDTAYGISGKFGNEAEVIELKSAEIPNYSNMNSVMNQLISLGEKRKTTKFMSNADKTLAESLSNQLRGLLREQILGPGTVTDPERAILNEIVQNPTTWMDTAGNTQSKIDSLKGIRKDAFNKLKTRLTGLGLDVAEVGQRDASSPSKSSVDFNQETSSGLGYTEINLDQL
jgi:flagellar biosynthesis regulator FlbT